MGQELQISDFDYDLPERLIAQEPCPQRDQARLLVVDRHSQSFSDHFIHELPSLLRRNDLLVFNNSKVIPARLYGIRTNTGGRWEGLFLSQADGITSEFMSHARGYLRVGEWIELLDRKGNPSSFRMQVSGRTPEKHLLLQPGDSVSIQQIMEEVGHVPIPPYIRKGVDKLEDRERYQTIYGSVPGSVAAPTAGLHFTPTLLGQLAEADIEQAFVTLHVGIGTFQPIKTEIVSAHRMQREWCEVPETTARAIQKAQEGKGRVIAVGTTSVRTLESAQRLTPKFPQAWSGWTDLFIHPPIQFQVIDGLLTNFHLPRSTLLILVSTFAGRELMQQAYEHAVRHNYRFFSYGDAMLIL